MKKLLTIILIAALTASCFVGCGKESAEKTDVNETTSAQSENVSTEVSEEAPVEVPAEATDQPTEFTLTYAVTDPYTGEVSLCTVTYNPTLIQPNAEVPESTEPIADLTYDYVEFYHIEYDTLFTVRFLPGYYSIDAYYNNEVAYWTNSDDDITYAFSDCTLETVGTVELHSYTEYMTMADGRSSAIKRWAPQFEAGILLIESYGEEEEISIADDAIADLLVKITTDDEQAGALDNTFTMYDYNTREAVYTVTFDPRFFSVSDARDPRSGEIILNCLDPELPYPAILLYVNKYSSGESLFNSKSEYAYGINYYGTPGNYLETGGTIGDATVYLGYGLAPGDGVEGYVFFAEMSDGNVITGNIPNTEIGDRLMIEPAFVSVTPAE